MTKSNCEMMAEEYSLNAVITDGSEEGQGLTPQQRICAHSGFLAGYNARDGELRASSEEFDNQKLYDAYPSLGLDYKTTYGICEVGARWQHEQDQLKIQATKDLLTASVTLLKDRDQKIQDLEAENARLKEKHESRFEGRA